MHWPGMGLVFSAEETTSAVPPDPDRAAERSHAAPWGQFATEHPKAKG